MESFLSLVANDMFQHYGADMHRVTVVFPSRRAASFFFDELSRCSQTPVWAPSCVTIDQLFAQLSPFKDCDRLLSVCQLYQAYIKHVGPLIQADGESLENETLDRFWGWGEVLLSDLDDVDKHLADAEKIFALIHDDEELKSFDYLDEHQKEVLQRFLSFTSEGGTALQRRFLRLWSKMGDIYRELNEVQRESGQLYSGALQRDVIENQLKNASLGERWPHICFVGFNVLNDVEKRLFNAFKTSTHARFYWDYDEFYLRNKMFEAGHFMSQNLIDFPMPETLAKESFDNLSNLEQIDLVVCSTGTSQARFVEQWLDSVQPTSAPCEASRHDAVVLCDEQLIMPLMHALPTPKDGQPQPNITMGFPITDTLVYGFIDSLIALQIEGYDTKRKKFRDSYLRRVEENFYAGEVGANLWKKYVGEETLTLLEYLLHITNRLSLNIALTKLDEHPERKPMNMDVLYSESAMQIHRTLVRFKELLSDEQVPMCINVHSLRRLLSQALSSISIPFHGDQMKGLQIMGVLETRCLDFNHLIMLSVEENCLPKKANETSFIMPNVREAFGLTTVRHQMAVYSYYFFRLIQRAQHLTCVYNDSRSGNQLHEISRFLRQLQAETNIKFNEKRLILTPQVTLPDTLSADGENFSEQLFEAYSKENEKGERKALSPTAINAYLDCPLKFFYRYVAHIKQEDEEEEGVDDALFGVIFHNAAQALYDHLIKRQKGTRMISEAMLTDVLNDEKLLSLCLDASFYAYYFHPFKNEKEAQDCMMMAVARRSLPQQVFYQGRDVLVRHVLLEYLRKLIMYDQKRAPFTVEALESETSFSVDIETPNGQLKLNVGGRIDRMDCINNDTLRVIDYKTGSVKEGTVPSVENLFVDRKKQSGYFFQAMLYALSVHKSNQNKKMETALLYLRKLTENSDFTLKFGQNKDKYNVCDSFSEFEQKLKDTLTEIFSCKSFPQTKNKDVICKSCSYKTLCGIKDKA